MEINKDNEEEDQLCNEAMDLYEEEERLLDAACNEALDLLENNTSDNEVEEAEQSGGQFKFEMFPHTDKRARKFGVHRRVFTSRLTQPRNFSDIPRADLPRLIERALQQAIAIQVLNGHENDQDFLMINMSSNRLRHSYQSHRIRVGEWKNNEEPARQLLDMLSRILNSNEQFQVDDSFHIEVTHVQNPGRGSGRKRYRLGTTHIDELLKRKKSVVLINNDKDELCCARALVTAQAYHEYGTQHNLYKDIKKGCYEQKQRAQALHAEARVPEAPCGLGELELFQIVLDDYQIVVVSVDHGYQIIFKGPERDKQLVLIKVGKHYHTCNNLAAFMGKSYYCVQCEKSFNNNDKKHHRCPGKRCFACHQFDCTDFKTRVGERADLPCHQCDRFFFGAVCQTNHLLHRSEGAFADPAQKNSVCDTHKRCKTCYKVYTGKEIKKGHKCGYAECPSCKQYFNLYTHQCYLQVIEDKQQKQRRSKRKRKQGATAGLATLRANDSAMDEDDDPPDPPPLFIYFDIEARQDQGEHVANLLCAEREDNDQCEVFEGDTCLEEFLDWLRAQTQTNDPNVQRQVIAVAHNFQGYDSYFVLDELYKQCICPQQIVNGAKILSMEIDHIKFIDSMCFLQMALSDFTAAFGLEELKKGFFPHFFNTLEHQKYVGPVPAQDYYDPAGMKPKRKEAFEAWHQARREEEYEFNFHEELIAYCQSDVHLLKQGCMQFQKEFEREAQFNPMEQCITIASACNRYYRKKCLQPFTIASEPVRGWHGKSKPHSFASMEWLYWINHQLRQERNQHEDQLIHAHNQGEHSIRINGQLIHVDGFDPTTQTVYEFQGCFYHGCPTCFPNRDIRHKKHDDMTMRQIHELTENRIQAIRNAGYPVVEMWECEWNQHKETQLEICNFLYTLKLTERLEPRDAFFGGRTNAIQLYCQTQPGEQIRYVDYTSLYPWVNKNCLYPAGHPTIITQPQGTDISDCFGLIKCDILPPYQLYHPVLPIRCQGKLIFPLCRTCTETQLKLSLLARFPDCPHSDEERTLTGTWCTPEIEEALQQGYRLLKVHEVWHFNQQSQTLFKSYVNTFLKMKQEASGWPSDVGMDSEKQTQYLKAYERHEGIQLNPMNISKNPGKRSLAKMMLNSFWGKFGQQANKCQVEGFTSPSKFHDLLRDDSKHIHSVRIVNEEMLEVVHNHQDECAPIQVNINIFIACFTTCWARLKLYEGIKQLHPEQVLYFDTDSLIYHWKPGQPELPLGNHLGEFTNELKPGDHIVEFAAAGPKNYAYKTHLGKTECKVRGFSLNSRGQQQLNFDILKKNVQDELQYPQVEARDIPVWNPFKITRDNRNKKLCTQSELKRYQLVFDKRVINPITFQSYPYGFKKYELNDNLDEDILSSLMADLDC